VCSDIQQLWEAIGDTNRRVSDDGADIEVMSGRVSALDAKVAQATAELAECSSDSGNAFGTVAQMQEQLALVHRLVNDMRSEIDHKVGGAMGSTLGGFGSGYPPIAQQQPKDPAVQSIIASAMSQLETTIHQPSSTSSSPAPTPKSVFSRSSMRSGAKVPPKNKTGLMF